MEIDLEEVSGIMVIKLIDDNMILWLRPTPQISFKRNQTVIRKKRNQLISIAPMFDFNRVSIMESEGE